MPDATATLTLHHCCATCAGTGALPDPGRFHCTHCAAVYGEAERLSATSVQPCGHVSLHQQPGARCAACDGRGRWNETVTLGELAAWITEQRPAEAAAAEEQALPPVAFEREAWTAKKKGRR